MRKTRAFSTVPNCEYSAARYSVSKLYICARGAALPSATQQSRSARSAAPHDVPSQTGRPFAAQAPALTLAAAPRTSAYSTCKRYTAA